MSTATTLPAAPAAVDIPPAAPVPPERLAILLALGVRDGLPMWRGQQLITDRPDDMPPLLTITFPTHQAADAWAAIMTKPHRNPIHSDGQLSIHADWHGWRVIVSGIQSATRDLDEVTAALAAQLDDVAVSR